MVEGLEVRKDRDQDVIAVGFHRCLEGSSMWDLHYSNMDGLGVARTVFRTHVTSSLAQVDFRSVHGCYRPRLSAGANISSTLPSQGD